MGAGTIMHCGVYFDAANRPYIEYAEVINNGGEEGIILSVQPKIISKGIFDMDVIEYQQRRGIGKSRELNVAVNGFPSKIPKGFKFAARHGELKYISKIYTSLGLLFQRAAAAFLAIALRFAGVRDSALAFPPFNPPRRPSVTAAGFLTFSGLGACPVACWTTENAISFASLGPFPRLLERFGIDLVCGK
jgi:hypothetical protein